MLHNILPTVIEFLNENGCLFLEIGYNQAKEVQDLLSKDFETKVIKDYSDNDRVICAKLK